MADHSFQKPDNNQCNNSDVWKDDPYNATVKVDIISDKRHFSLETTAPFENKEKCLLSLIMSTLTVAL